MVDITNKIYVIRNQKVMLDRDLAELYGVEVKRLNEQVKRNIERFPEDLMFKLNINELEQLRPQMAQHPEIIKKELFLNRLNRLVNDRSMIV